MTLTIDLDSQDIQTLEEFRVLGLRLTAEAGGLNDKEFARFEDLALGLAHKMSLAYIGM